MITGREIHTLNNEAIQTIGLNGTAWDNLPADTHTYFDKLAELVSARFTGTATVQQEPLACDVIEMLANLPEDRQALVYHWLYKIGHRVYK